MKKPPERELETHEELEATVTGVPESPESLKRGAALVEWLLQIARRRKEKNTHDEETTAA